MDANLDGMLPVKGKQYAVTYKNEYDQPEILNAILIHPDLNGFTVFRVDDKRVIIPKDRIFILRETEVKTSEEPKEKAAPTGTQSP
jgi:hypothetical protein